MSSDSNPNQILKKLAPDLSTSYDFFTLMDC